MNQIDKCIRLQLKAAGKKGLLQSTTGPQDSGSANSSKQHCFMALPDMGSAIG
ncbi:hypothetical protein ACE4RR_08965 [Alteribacillus sp. HJP-4]